MLPPPVWLVLVFWRASWWMTWPVAGVGLVGGAVAMADGGARREAVALARRGVVETWGWLAEGGLQRQWRQVLYGWDSANPDRAVDATVPSPEEQVESAAPAVASSAFAAPPTKPVPVPSSPPTSPTSSPRRRKKPSVG